jgi:hypothetical protein
LQDEAIFSGVGGIGQLDSEHIFDYVCATVQAVEARRVYITHHDNFHAPFGQMEQSREVPSFDHAGGFNLLQLVMAEKLVQPLFGGPIAKND